VRVLAEVHTGAEDSLVETPRSLILASRTGRWPPLASRATMADVDADEDGRDTGGAEISWALRPMSSGDVNAVVGVVEAAHSARPRRDLDAPRTPPTEAQRDASSRGHARFVERDGPGAWVAVADDRVVGVAESIRRGDFWGLSMLFVHPDVQDLGVGRELLEASRCYGEGARERMIQSSADPRAMRRYAHVGLAMHPAAEIAGVPDRTAIPSPLAGRAGDRDDLDLVEAVEAQLGRSRTEDVAFLLEDDASRLEVVDDGPRRGWALCRRARVIALGATDDGTAATLLWRYLAGLDSEATVFGLTAAQNWAFTVAHAARLTLRVEGAMFVGGMDMPGPWIPSGWYF